MLRAGQRKNCNIACGYRAISAHERNRASAARDLIHLVHLVFGCFRPLSATACNFTVSRKLPLLCRNVGPAIDRMIAVSVDSLESLQP